jgi:O-antigen ligase
MQALLHKNAKQIYWAYAAFTILCIVLSVALSNNYLALVPVAALCAFVFITDIRIAYWLLIACLPISVNLIEFGGPSLDFPDELLMLVLTAFFPMVLYQNRDTLFVKGLVRTNIVASLILWYLWMIVCTVDSTHPILSTKFVLAKIWYYIPFIFYTALIAFHNPNAIKSLARMIIAIGTFCVAVVLYRHSQIAFSFENVNDAGAPVFRNHVIYGSLISMLLPIVAGALWLTKRFSLKWLILVAVFLINFAGLYFAYSRGAWAAVLFASVIALALPLRKAPWVIATVYLVLASLTIWLAQQNRYIDFAPKKSTGIMHENLVDHLVATLRGKDISSNERFYRWVAAARMSVDNPITGTGPNTFYEHYKAYTVVNFATYVSRNEERSTTHNYFLFMLVEQGYVGVFFYAWFIWLLFYKGQQLYTKANGKFDKTIIASLLSIMAAFFINNTLSEVLENDKLAGLFFISIGCLLAIQLQQKEEFKLRS